MKWTCLLHTLSLHWLDTAEHNLGDYMLKKVELQEKEEIGPLKDWR